MEISESELNEIVSEFERQFPNLHIGGFYNPTIEHMNEKEICFRCYYNNYNNEEDSWYWTYDKETKIFCN